MWGADDNEMIENRKSNVLTKYSPCAAYGKRQKQHRPLGKQRHSHMTQMRTYEWMIIHWISLKNEHSNFFNCFLLLRIARFLHELWNVYCVQHISRELYEIQPRHLLQKFCYRTIDIQRLCAQMVICIRICICNCDSNNADEKNKKGFRICRMFIGTGQVRYLCKFLISFRSKLY